MLQISQKTFLWTGLVVFFVAAITLFALHNRALDPDQSGNWWAVRFVDPGNRDNLAFEIENHSDHSAGKYTIVVDGVTAIETPFTTESALTRIVPTPRVEPGWKVIRITVTLGTETKFLTR